MKNQWLFSKKIDLWFLTLPVVLTWVFCFLMPTEFHLIKIPLWVWVIFILGIDVSHVWSTIWRTYFDKQEFKAHKKLLIFAPIIAFISIFLLTQISTFFFWRILAYIALFHFIKQQYGFFALYRAKFGHFIPHKIFKDNFTIYFSMLYPIFYWHLNGNRLFNWFINGDFITINDFLANIGITPNMLFYFNIIANTIYWCVLIGWTIEEFLLSRKHNLPLAYGKIIWLISTGINWYLGIVYFNSDIAFSVTNVVAHGIPYCVLIFIYVNKKKEYVSDSSMNVQKWIIRIFLMLGVVFLFAFFEEYCWDMFINQERQLFFTNILSYPFASVSNSFQAKLTISILSIPQVTHYIIDGFIWKNNDKNPFLKPVLLS